MLFWYPRFSDSSLSHLIFSQVSDTFPLILPWSSTVSAHQLCCHRASWCLWITTIAIDTWKELNHLIFLDLRWGFYFRGLFPVLLSRASNPSSLISQSYDFTIFWGAHNMSKQHDVSCQRGENPTVFIKLFDREPEYSLWSLYFKLSIVKTVSSLFYP